MRTIQFRGKTIESAGMRNAGEWAYGGYFVDDCYGGCPEGKHHIVEWNSTGLGYFAHSRVKRETVGQYTGVRDVHGKAIYEGDIVTVQHMIVENVPSYRAVIEWDKYRFAIRNLQKPDYRFGNFPLNNLDPFGLNLEIIGNVYENPELLKID